MHKESKTIAMTPAELRPYEKCEALGAEYLSDPELLAVIIKSGTNQLSSVGLAEQLLYPDGRRVGLNFLTSCTMDELREIRGIGRVKAIQLVCLGELCRRMAAETAGERVTMQDPQTLAAYYMQSLRNLAEEEVHAMLLDTRGRLIRSRLISRGTISYSAISPREVFAAALSARAASFVIVHNHPSGDPQPSSEDIRFSTLLKELGVMMILPLLDSVIIGDNTYASLKELGLL